MTSSKVQLSDIVQFPIASKSEEEKESQTPDPPEDAELPRRGDNHAPQRLTSNGRAGLSAAFLVLVDQLVHQHKIEVASANFRQSGKSFDISRGTVDLNTGYTTDLERLVSVDESAKRTSKGSQESGLSSEKSPPKSVAPARSPTVAKVMCHKHGDLKEMHASKILDAFDMQALLEQHQEDEKMEKEIKFLHTATKASFQTFEWEDKEQTSCSTRLQRFLQSTKYEFTISVVLALNVLWMAFELEVEGGAAGMALGVYPAGMDLFANLKDIFLVGDHIFAYIFIFDVVVRLSVLRCQFFKACLNYVDIAVSLTSLLEVVLTNNSLDMPVPPVLFKLLRIGKLARAIRMITMTTMLLSLQLLIKCLAASRGMLFWSFCLMSFVQCVAGMILATLCQDFIQDPSRDASIREQVFRYYGTFTRTWLTMFEILFANWSPPCRILVENVNEWFSVFFLVYRCVLGFAVINVVNSVFVQQTMKTASSDEDLAFRQKQKDIAAYTRKVRKLFQTMDASGDGTINLEEFSKLVTNPKLNFWMSQLELEYHDLMSLFEFLDNGDGEITLSEFIEGAAKLRGHAKALDIWRMETKLEVLFEEVLNVLRPSSVPSFAVQDPVESPPITRTASVQDIFANSQFKHIKTTLRGGDTNVSGISEEETSMEAATDYVVTT